MSAPRARVYQYCNASRTVVFEVVRRESGGDEAVFPRHRGPDGKDVLKVPAAGRGLLYRLPEVLAAATEGEPVCVVETEKDADRLVKLGFMATCNAMGAGKWRAAHSGGFPAGTDVVIFPDYDQSGMNHVEQIVTSLLKAGTVNSVRVVDLEFETRPKHGRTVSDWLNADPASGAAEVQRLIDAAVPAADWTAPVPEASREAEGSEKGVRPIVEYQGGQRLNWTRAAIAMLVEIGTQNDLNSLYASELVVQEGGASAGYLVALSRAREPKEGAVVQTPEGTLLMTRAEDRDVQANIDEHLRWRKVQTNGVAIDADPTRENAKEILARYKADSTHTGYTQFRILRGIVDTPTLRSDGTLLSKSGYDQKSGLYVDFNEIDWPKIPAVPTREDARTALATLYDLVKESSFKARYDKAVWVAFLLTILARIYVCGNVPVFGFSANAPRIGKGTLVDLAAIIATSKGVTKWAPVSAARTRDVENEERKRLMSVALSGIRVLCIDNVKAGDLMGTPALDMVITSGDNSTYGRIADRVLGVTGIAEAPWTCVVAATGNNLRVRGDMGGRTVMCNLETHHVEPEMIQYRHHADPQQHARDHRKELLVAALTVLLAHKQAIDDGDPEALLPKIGSFGRWSDRIRSAVWWADPNQCDPWLGNAEVKANAQPEQVEALVFFEAWHSAIGTVQVSAKEIAERCASNSALAEAVMMLSIPEPKGNDIVNTRALGHWLAIHKGWPGEYALREGDRKSGKLYWYVEHRESRAEAYDIRLHGDSEDTVRKDDDGYYETVEVDVTKETDARKEALALGNLTVGAMDGGALVLVYNPIRKEDDDSILEAITGADSRKVESHLMYGTVRTVRADDDRRFKDVKVSVTKAQPVSAALAALLGKMAESAKKPPVS